MKDDSTLDLRGKLKLNDVGIEQSPHLLRIGDSADTELSTRIEPQVVLASATLAETLPAILYEPIKEVEPAEPLETKMATVKEPYRASSHFSALYNEPIIWEGYLHGHSPDLARVGVFILFLLGMAIFSFLYQGSFISGVLFLSMIFALIAHVIRDKEHSEFKVDELGVSVHGRLYQYKEVESFWIEYSSRHDIKELSLHLKKTLHPYLKIPLHDADPVQLRRFMLHYLPEVEHKPNLADALSRHLRI